MDTAIPSDRPSAIPSADRWVTLHELAEIRGISQHSAARLVRRHGWRRQRDNQGRVRALVPIEALDRPSAVPDSPSASPGELTAAIEPLVGLLRDQIERERIRAGKAEGLSTELRQRLEAVEGDLRQARETADQARRHAREAEDALATLRRAEAKRKARGRWARLRAAWRGSDLFRSHYAKSASGDRPG